MAKTGNNGETVTKAPAPEKTAQRAPESVRFRSKFASHQCGSRPSGQPLLTFQDFTCTTDAATAQAARELPGYETEFWIDAPAAPVEQE